jgi:nucleolar protein 58
MRRFKLKFSPDKVDTMIVQAIALLDDLDKEINIYSMRVKVSLLVSACKNVSHCVPVFS